MRQNDKCAHSRLHATAKPAGAWWVGLLTQPKLKRKGGGTMILACSARALERIEKAKRAQAAKKTPAPIVMKDKRLVARVRAWLKERTGCEQLVWNFDVEDYPVAGAKGEPAGYFTCGYVFSSYYRLTAILNALDDVDLCAIGELAAYGIWTISQDCYTIPTACDQLLDDSDELARGLFQFLRDERAVDWLDMSRVEWPSPTIVIPNNDRSAATGLSRVVEAHANRLASGHTPVTELPDIDRGTCYYINGMPVTIKAAGKSGYQFPAQFWHASLRERYGHVKCPAVRLRVKLLDGYVPRSSRRPKPFKPECYRDLLIPLEAPLSWVHQVIQKTFYWGDYHLHEFQFLDPDARELLKGAFYDLFEIDPFWDDYENPFAAPDGEQRFVQVTKMSLRWLYRGFAETAQCDGMTDGDFPSAKLPEGQPIGLFLLGSAEYPKVMEALQAGTRPEAPISRSQGIYYHYDFGSDKELALFPLEYCVADAYDLPRIVGAAGHTPPEDSSVATYCKLIDVMERGKEETLQGQDDHGTGDDVAADDEFGDYIIEDDPNEDVEEWARGNGWRPFTSLEDLEDFFGKRTGMR